MLGVIVLFVLYFLSVGLAIWIYVNFLPFNVTAVVFGVVYNPLTWLARHNELFADFFTWYLSFWMSLVP